MSDAILRYFKLYKLPPGRRIHALKQVSARARELGLTSIAEYADMAIAEDEKILDMQRLRSIERRALYGEDAVALDNQVDRSVNAFDDYIAMQARVVAGDSPRATAAGVLRTELLPRGAGAITHLSYVEQHAEINRMLDRAEQAKVAVAVAELPDARPLLDIIKAVNQRYGASLGEYSSVPSAAEIKAANAQGHVRMCELVSMIFAYFAMNPSADRSQRDHLLESIERQNDAARELRRRRRAMVDIDAGEPDTDLDLDFPDPGTEQELVTA